MRAIPVRRREGTRAWLLPALMTALMVGAASAPAARGAEEVGALDEALRKALDAPGWVELPRQIIEVRHSGPTPAAAPGMPPGPVWYGTAWIDANSRPHVNEHQERAFVRSV